MLRRAPPGRHRDDRALRAPRTATACTRRMILAWTTLDSTQAVHGLGLERLAAIQEERAASRPARIPSAAAAIAAQRPVARTPRPPRRSWWRWPGPGRAELGGRPRVLRPSARGELRGSRVEEFREADTPFAFYNPPRRTARAPASTTSTRPAWTTDRCTTWRAVTYHEANPGHHFQIAIEQEIPDRPALRRFGGHPRRAARSSKGGVSTRSAWPTRWACTSTTGNGSACSKPGACAPRAS